MAEKTLLMSIKPNRKHSILERLIKEVDPSQDTSRSSFTCRALEYSVNVDNWFEIKNELDVLKDITDIDIPKSMNIRLDERAMMLLNDKVRPQMEQQLKNAGVIKKVLQNRYMLQLLWFHYLKVMKEKAFDVGAKKSIMADKITAPDMFKILAEIVLLNREEDIDTIEKLKTIFSDWRNKNG
ncbi:MAG: hypothetical protein GX217_03270 [Clostridiaceae bacterium]|jgi:hypothetical protein|nr:hypothetical protein [Clostridiaceae bacterium]